VTGPVVLLVRGVVLQGHPYPLDTEPTLDAFEWRRVGDRAFTLGSGMLADPGSVGI
jgi:hypothetical protein